MRGAWAGSQGGPEVLRTVLAATVHGDLAVRPAQERIEAAGSDLQGCGGRVEEGAAVQFERRPGLRARLDLVGEPSRVAGRLERFARQKSRDVVLTVSVARCPAPHRDQHVRPKPADRPHQIGKQGLAGPLFERLLRRLRVSEVEGAAEVLSRSVDRSCGQELSGADDPESLPELRSDEILSALATREREVRGFHAPPARHRGEESRVFIIRVCRHDEHPLDPVQLTEEESRLDRTGNA